MKKPSTRYVVVSIEQAKKWLAAEVNENNRNISAHTVTGYAIEMRAGRWLIGPPIMFNSTGKLIDGQHRLQAVIEYGKGVEFAVWEGVDDGVRAIIDQGRARSVPDILRMMYGTSRASMVTGVIRVIDNLISGQKTKLSVGHAVDMIASFDEAFRWATDAVPGKSAYSSSPIVAALVYAHKTAPATIDTFARRLFVGADLAQTSPVLIVRNQIQRMGTLNYQDQKREAFMIVLHAVYKTMRSESIHSKTIRVREDMIEFFGEVHRRSSKRKAA